MANLFPNGIHGLADSRWSGVEGSVAVMKGIDIHSTPGLIKVHQKLTKDSGATVDALVRVRVAASDGSTLWFSYTTGKIWRRTSAGAWALEHTTTPAAGTAGCLGAEEYDGYIYWATQSRLHRKPTTDLSDWTDAEEDWATFQKTDAEFHPMVKQNLQLFIGDANVVAKVDNSTGSHVFDNEALDLNTPFRVKTMIDFDIDILIGTITNTTVNKTEVLRWDTEDTSWVASDQIDENGINCFIRDDNFVYVNAGQFGRIYVYTGDQLVPAKRIPGSWSPTKTAEIYPQAATTLLTIPVFGLSNITGNPAEQGVYSFGAYSKDYSKVLDLSYVISENVVATIEIGSVLAVGADLLVAWKNGSSFGVDKLDYTAKYASAVIETRMLSGGELREALKTLGLIYANYASLPASTGITFSYRKYAADSYTALTAALDDTKLQQLRSEISAGDIANLQLKIAFTVSSNDAPEIEQIGYKDNTTDA